MKRPASYELDLFGEPISFSEPGEVDAWASSSVSGAVVGVDEVGRGPLAGPVVAAAVVLGDEIPPGIDDSKRLTEKKRLLLAREIVRTARAFGVARVEAAEIDRLNILAATQEAMRQAIARVVRKLGAPAGLVLVDGNVLLPKYQGPQRTLVGGDHLSLAIGAASILAKVSRDLRMASLDKVYPGYDFAKHKGYGTAAHLKALRELGPCPEHRKSFKVKGLSNESP